MSDILTQIGAYKRREIAEAKVRVPRGTLEREIRDQSPPRGFLKALERAREEGRFGLVAEIKKASPSKGLMRKDFLYDSYQVLEARAWGADCILIIMAAVDDETARALNKSAHDLGLDVLIEIHDEAELGRAL